MVLHYNNSTALQVRDVDIQKEFVLKYFLHLCIRCVVVMV